MLGYYACFAVDLMCDGWSGLHRIFLWVLAWRIEGYALVQIHPTYSSG